MSGVPRRSPDRHEARSVLGPARNKSKLVPITQNSDPKPLAKVNKQVEQRSKDPCSNGRPLATSLSAPSALRRQDLLLASNLSLNASCSSDASTDSFCSRASTGRIGRVGVTNRRRHTSVFKLEKIATKLERAVLDNGSKMEASVEASLGARTCAWVTANTDPCYIAFHDEEWGVPVHDDKKLFELLVLSGALAELTWPVILSKRHIFREVFMDFDPMLVSKLNEKKIMAPGSTASSLLSEPKLRAIIGNAHQILKVIEEFGSFDQYCWNFVNQKPVVSRFRYARQVPVKTPKADAISKDLVRRGFRSVGPTVIYSFMQAAGMTNDHLVTCFRFEVCLAAAASEKVMDGATDPSASNSNHKVDENMNVDEEVLVVDVELSRAVSKVSIL